MKSGLTSKTDRNWNPAFGLVILPFYCIIFALLSSPFLGLFHLTTILTFTLLIITLHFSPLKLSLFSSYLSFFPVIFSSHFHLELFFTLPGLLPHSLRLFDISNGLRKLTGIVFICFVCPFAIVASRQSPPPPRTRH